MQGTSNEYTDLQPSSEQACIALFQTLKKDEISNRHMSFLQGISKSASS